MEETWPKVELVAGLLSSGLLGSDPSSQPTPTEEPSKDPEEQKQRLMERLEDFKSGRWDLDRERKEVENRGTNLYHSKILFLVDIEEL